MSPAPVRWLWALSGKQGFAVFRRRWCVGSHGTPLDCWTDAEGREWEGVRRGVSIVVVVVVVGKDGQQLIVGAATWRARWFPDMASAPHAAHRVTQSATNRGVALRRALQFLLPAPIARLPLPLCHFAARVPRAQVLDEIQHTG